MKIPEILVIILTFLIFVALSILVYGLSKGWHKESNTNIENKNYGSLYLKEPIGSEINSINHFNNLLVISISGPDKNSARLILLNPTNGEIYSKIFLNNK